MSEIRFGLIGSAGYIRRFADKVLADGGAVTVVYCPEATDGYALAETYGCRYEPELAKAIADDQVDAVIITSPVEERGSQIRMAAQAGKHVYVEKPAFFSAREAREVAGIVKASGIKLVVSDPIVIPLRQMLLAREFISSGELGGISLVRTKSALPNPSEGITPPEVLRTQKGFLTHAVGPHAICMLHFFLGRPKYANAILSSFKGIPVEDNVVCSYEYENGAIGLAETSLNVDRREDGFLISGTKGTIFATEKDFMIRLRGEPWVNIPEARWPALPIYPLNYLLQCIREDRQPAYLGIDFALDQAEMIDAAYRSAGTKAALGE